MNAATAPFAHVPTRPSSVKPAPEAPAAVRCELHPASLVRRVIDNRYLTEEVLAPGPFSLRYRAYDIALDESVTIELLLRCSPQVWPSVRQAISKLATHAHPHAAALLGRGMFDSTWPYMVVEHHGERTLRQLLDESGPLGLARALRIGVQCAGALASAHAKGIVHGAFSPERVRVHAPGSTTDEAVKIDGLGLALLIDESRDVLLTTPGAYEYVAPEQIVGASAQPISDVYSLGAVLYELVAGHPPFSGPAAAVLEQHLDAHAEPLSRRAHTPDLTLRVFDKIISRCLAKAPAHRYASALELSADLQRLETALKGRAPAARRVPSRANKSSAVKVAVAAQYPARRATVDTQALPKVIVNVLPGARSR